ncbi:MULTISPECIES: diguanylate cyclase [Shewanella]|uniref:diguanylate cyclase n=2 Tax=Shewanella psychromarinicola TaxID=2487742 RepID=A0A3N4DRX8_9GAMM|nr:diguanylate cyclase [Shewanella psychromarinicola]AZG36276.1 diguanylate cyclase [Shewanella psychromarinicola]MCL1082189.1 diguanylate cyclase [Shewanella psychromarinicola]RPA27392.1 diguanylate cyclase [Shewanella psychromarinicola]
MLAPPKILIVDDRIENLITLDHLLSEFNVTLIRATSGEQALAHTLDNDFALVLLDVRMPTMDGYEVAELMRGNKKTRNIPIIFITAESSADANIFKGYQSGAVDYLVKPLNADIFSSKISVFLQLYEQKHALHQKNIEFDHKLAELEELQQQLEETNQQLLMLSTLDGLTGLVNRRKFDEIFSDEWQRASRSATAMAVIMMDIDCFKMFNDTFGHQQGDNCLLSVASTLKGMDLRHLDKIARIGGEEFAVILPETDSNGAMLVAERIRKTIEALKIPHSKASGNPWVTASFGVSSIIPHRGCNPRVLMETADRALYESKHKGRNCCSEKQIIDANIVSIELDAEPMIKQKRLIVAI